jgi:hypothetical protein
VQSQALALVFIDGGIHSISATALDRLEHIVAVEILHPETKRREQYFS